MRITFDDVADVVHIELSPGPATLTRKEGPGVIVGYDENDRIMSIQVLDASKQFDADTLALLRGPVTYLSLAEASKVSGLSANTLRLLLNNGRLKGEKRGRDWVVTAADLGAYLESRAPAGRPAFRYKARRIRPITPTDPSGERHGFIVRPDVLARNQRAGKLNPKGIADAAKMMFGTKKVPKVRKK